MDPLVDEQEKFSEEDEARYRTLVRAYGKVLETTAELGSEVSDISWLPASKEEIKKALLWKIRNAPEMKDQIVISYSFLCEFQPDVGSDIPNFIVQHDRNMKEQFGLDPDIDLMSYLKKDENSEKFEVFVKKFLELSAQHNSLMKKWKPIIESERAELDQELIDLGYLPEDFHQQATKQAGVMLKEIREKRTEEVSPNTPEPEPKSSSIGKYLAWGFAIIILIRILRALFLDP